VAACLRADDVRLIGSGASFPFPIYSTWFKSFRGKTKGVTVDYQAKGSGAGSRPTRNRAEDEKTAISIQLIPMVIDQGYCYSSSY